MKRTFQRSCGFVVLVVVLVGSNALYAGGLTSLSLGSTTLDGFTPSAVDIRKNSLTAVEGFTVAVGYDTAHVIALDFGVAGDAAVAEFVSNGIFNDQGGATLQAILDLDPPFGGPLIPAGNGILIAELTLQASAAVATPQSTPLDFVDGVFSIPPVSNSLTIAGAPVDAAQGLVLNSGSVTCNPPPNDTLAVEDATLVSLEQGAVRVLLSNESGAVQGFVLAIAHDPALLQLDEINVEGTVTEAIGAEFVAPNTSPAGGVGGTVGVVLDFNAPFFGQTIPVGFDQHVANYVYTALPDLLEGVDAPLSTNLNFIDGALGSPVLDNVLVIVGLSVQPILIDGVVTIDPHPEAVDLGLKFYCGPRDFPLDGMGAPILEPMTALRGDSMEICVHYTSSQFNVQGFQIALCLDCELIVCDFSVEDTIVGAVGAEFVSWQYDAVQDDGDGCEFVAGILLDASPPFDGQTVPPTDIPLAIGCLEVKVADVPVCRSEPGNRGSGINFYCGPPGLEVDGDGHPITPPIDVVPGDPVTFCLYYTSDFAELDGLSLALCYDCDLTLDFFTVAGTILNTVGAEFVNFNIDNDPSDGDGCELVVGILLDAFPPFDGQTLPPTTVPEKIATLEMTVSPDAPCESFLNLDFCDFVDGAGTVPIQNVAVVGTVGVQDIGKFCCAARVRTNPTGAPCDKLGVQFCDSINGLGSVLIENLFVIDTQGLQDAPTCGCEVCLDRTPEFKRGDCNLDDKVNVADSNSVLTIAYQGLVPGCEDACDINDDGLINLADSVYVLSYLFGFGAPIPAPTHPDCGPDPTEDELGCLVYTFCTW